MFVRVWTYMGFRRHYQKHITLSFLTHAHIDAARGLTCVVFPLTPVTLFLFYIINGFFFHLLSVFRKTHYYPRNLCAGRTNCSIRTHTHTHTRIIYNILFGPPLYITCDVFFSRALSTVSNIYYYYYYYYELLEKTCCPVDRPRQF